VLVYPWLLLIPLGIWWLCWKYGSDPSGRRLQTAKSEVSMVAYARCSPRDSLDMLDMQ